MLNVLSKASRLPELLFRRGTRAALPLGLVCGLFMAGPALAQLATISCASNATEVSNILNTGTDGHGGILAGGSAAAWSVSIPGILNATNNAGDPASVPAANWKAAVVAANLAQGAWRPNAADAAWISQSPDGAQSPDGSIDVFYRIQFNIADAVDPAAFQLSMSFWADNSVAEVWVNGQPQSGLPGVGTLPQSPANPYESTNFTTAATEASYNFSHNWQTGTNTLIVDVKTKPGYVGLLAQFNAVPVCEPAIRVSKTAAPATALGPGDSVTYTVTVANAGAIDATDIKVLDQFPAGIASASWSCTDNSAAIGGGPYCPAPDSGGAFTPPAALLNQSIAALPAGGNVVYAIQAVTVAAGLPESIVNSVTAGVTDGVCVDASGAPTGQPMPCPATVANPEVPVIAITKVANTPAALAPGSRVTYTIRVANVGALDAQNVEIKDPPPDGIASMTWACADSAGAGLCPASAGGGGLNQTVAKLPPGSTLTYTVIATLAAGGLLPAQIANTATANVPGGLCSDGQAMPCPSANVTNLTVNLTQTPIEAAPVPALTPGALALLALLATLSLGGPAYLMRGGHRNKTGVGSKIF